MRLAKALTGAAALAVFALAGGAAFMGPLDPDIAREGSGPRRDALTDLETKPFPADFAKLTDWHNIDKFDADALKGKPVLVVTWSSWYRVSHPALTIAQDLADRYADQGLVVIGVHHERGYEGAERAAESKHVTFPYAHDADGSFRSTLNVDQDPDFYLIDRAGNLRYADVDTGSVGAGVAKLVAESEEEASTLLARIQADKAAAQDELTKAKRVRNAVKPGQVLNVPFRKPAISAYEGVNWPKHNEGNLGAENDVQGKPLPAAFGQTERIVSGPEPATNGRVLVIDFWATWCGPCRAIMPTLDSLQKKHRADLVIVGISDESVGKVRQFSEQNHYSFTKATDPSRRISRAVGVQGIPHTLIVSTDGVVRWQGNPHSDSFVNALETVIANDPGVRARRAAEEEYLRDLNEEDNVE